MADNILPFPGRPLPDDEGDDTPADRALRAALFPRETEVSVVHPLEIWLRRAVLIEEVETSIAALRANHDWARAGPAERQFIEVVLQQRVEFLEQLRTSTDEHVWMAIYPVENEPHLFLGEDLPEDDEPGIATATAEEDIPDDAFPPLGPWDEDDDDLPL